MSFVIRGLFNSPALPAISAGICSASMSRYNSSEKVRFKKSEIETAEMRNIKVKYEEKRAAAARLRREIGELEIEYRKLKDMECTRLLEAGEMIVDDLGYR